MGRINIRTIKPVSYTHLVLENGEYVVSTTDIVSDAYGWITAENAREEAAAVVESLEDTIEETTDFILEKQKELAELEDSLTGAERDLELGKIDARAQLDKRNLNYRTASEAYNVSVELSDFEADTAQACLLYTSAAVCAGIVMTGRMTLL